MQCEFVAKKSSRLTSFLAFTIVCLLFTVMPLVCACKGSHCLLGKFYFKLSTSLALFFVSITGGKMKEHLLLFLITHQIADHNPEQCNFNEPVWLLK